MSEPRSKLSFVLEHMEHGRWREAISLAAKFQNLGPHRNAILDAHRAYLNPDWLRQLGKCPDEAITAGRNALVDRYIKG